MRRFIDLSSYQDHVDFRAVKASGVAGVWLKATEGITYVNPRFRPQVVAAHAVGLRVGAYHYARPDRNNAAAEALHFASVVEQIGTRDLRPVLDLEAGFPGPAVATWARRFNGMVKSRLGAGALFYSYTDYIARLHPDKPIGYGLWLADYGPNDGREHSYRIPRPWNRVVAHQFTSHGHVPGVKGFVDVTEAPLSRVLAHPVMGLL